MSVWTEHRCLSDVPITQVDDGPHPQPGSEATGHLTVTAAAQRGGAEGLCGGGGGGVT